MHLPTGTVDLSRDQLAYLDHKDQGDLLVIKENLEIQETKILQVNMENQEELVKEEM